MSESSASLESPSRVGFARFAFSMLFGVVLPLAVLGAGTWSAIRLIETSPTAERKKGGGGEAQARLVEAVAVAKADHPVTIEAMGIVEPARQASLQAEVSGTIVSLSGELEPGGHFQAEEKMLSIDRRDYELIVRQREAEVAQAESDLRIEMGQQQIARQEFDVLGREIAPDEQSLVLREPQLAKAQADLQAAQTSLEAAKLDLARTQIVAPFNSLVLSENVEVGSMASTQGTLASLVGIDRFWVKLAVPLDELRWIDIPREPGGRGSLVRLTDETAWGKGVARTGYVTRSSADVDSRSRMVTLIVAVDDPLALEAENAGQPPLLLNSYVRGEIEGRMVADSVALSREFLHGGDTVWVMEPDGRLDIRRVEIAWRGRDTVYVVNGLTHGERVVTSKLTSPVQGMAMRLQAGSSSPSFSGSDALPGAAAPGSTPSADDHSTPAASISEKTDDSQREGSPAAGKPEDV